MPAKKKAPPPAKQPIEAGESLYEFYGILSEASGDEWEPPYHLAPIVKFIEGIASLETAGQKCTAHTPPQHGKSKLLQISTLWLGLKSPGVQLAFVTYDSEHTKKNNRELRDILISVGFKLVERRTQAKDEVYVTDTNFKFHNGSTVLWTYIGSKALGRSLDAVFIDDVYRSTDDAASLATRKKVEKFVSSSLMTRQKFTGFMSVLNCNQRMHRHDIHWYMAEVWGANKIVLPAIDEQGKALWEDRHSAQALLAEWGDKPEWEPMYQGNPGAENDAFFAREPSYYTELPPQDQTRFSIGLDLGYTGSAHSDWSCLVLLGEFQGNVYLLDMVRSHKRPGNFLALSKARFDGYGQWNFQGQGPEEETIRLYAKEYGFRYRFTNVKSKRKGDRAFHLAKLWNQGKFLLPSREKFPKLGIEVQDHLIPEFQEFTGNDDAHDDIIDSCVNGFSPWVRSSTQGWRPMPQQWLPF